MVQRSGKEGQIPCEKSSLPSVRVECSYDFGEEGITTAKALPLAYKISALWAGSAGSLLLGGGRQV